MALHRGTTVAIQDKGVLIRGPSGAGKSDLALRLIDRGAVLVADDYTEIAMDKRRLICTAPTKTKGLLEVRGVGLLRFDVKDGVPLSLTVDLKPRDDIARLPDKKTVEIEGGRVPVIGLHAFDASTPQKVELALAGLET